MDRGGIAVGTDFRSGEIGSVGFEPQFFALFSDGSGRKASTALVERDFELAQIEARRIAVSADFDPALTVFSYRVHVFSMTDWVSISDRPDYDSVVRRISDAVAEWAATG